MIYKVHSSSIKGNYLFCFDHVVHVFVQTKFNKSFFICFVLFACVL